MREHRVTIVQSAQPPTRYYGKCACGGRSAGWTADKQEVQDWEIKHHAYVQRVRSHLGTSTPSLKQQRDYFEEQAIDNRYSHEEKRLWSQLADELTARLGDRNADPGEQPPLW